MSDPPFMPIGWRELRAATLRPLLDTCVRFCRFVSHKPKEYGDVILYRSKSLEEAARAVFPRSCHTLYSLDLLRAFDAYLEKKKSLLSADVCAKEAGVTIGDPLSLLLVNWRESLFDGACSAETFGFLDDDCMPGWDTWVAIVTLEEYKDAHALLCWVPPEVCREVDSAIAVDAASCMSWLAFDDQNRPLLVGWGHRWTPCGRR